MPNRNTGLSDMPLFNDFKILVETLFGPLFLPGFNAKELETLVLSVGLIKITIFFGKTDKKLNIYKNISKRHLELHKDQ